MGGGIIYTHSGWVMSCCVATFCQDPLAGVVPRSLHEIFEKIEAQVTTSISNIWPTYVHMYILLFQNVSEFSIRVSFLELYNEELFDLLAPGEDSGNRLRIFEDSVRKVGACIYPPLSGITHNTHTHTHTHWSRCIGLCCDPWSGGASGPLQRRGVLHPGAGPSQEADGRHPPQRPVLPLSLRLLGHGPHQGELHRGRGAAQDWETESCMSMYISIDADKFHTFDSHLNLPSF